MATDNLQLFLDRFIAYNTSRYQGDDLKVRRITSLILSQITFTNFREITENGVTWNDVDTQTSVPVWASGETRSYNITGNTTAYASWRIAITAVNDTSRNWVAIAELKLMPLGAKFLLRKNGTFYNIINNALVQVTDTVTPAYINANGVSQINNLTFNQGAMDVVAAYTLNYTYTYTPNAQIALPSKLLIEKWGSINSMTLTTTETGSGSTRCAITTDLVNYYVFSGGAWVNIGTLTNDTTGANKLMS